MPTLAKFNPKIYRKLPQLARATENLAEVKVAFDEFMKEASKLVTDNKLADGQLGAFLLHRHWDLPAGSVLVERPRLLESGKVGLVTAPTDQVQAWRSGAAPSRWAAPDVTRPFAPLEFSADPFVIEIIERITALPTLVNGLAQLLKKYGLQETIGFMVVPRKSLSAQRYPDFVETNLDGMSIVTGERLSAKQKRQLITTGWPLASTRRGSVFACCYCSHPGGGTGCRHPKPDPPICRPHGCV